MHTQDIFLPVDEWGRTSTRRSAHCAARHYYHRTRAEDPPMREPVSACLSPLVCGKLIFRFLEVYKMSTKITHSLEEELKAAELVGGNWFWKHVSPIWTETLSVWRVISSSSKTLWQKVSKGPPSSSPNSTDFSICHNICLRNAKYIARKSCQGEPIGGVDGQGDI